MALRHYLFPVFLVLGAGFLAACAQPIYKNTGDVVDATPRAVAQTPDQYADRHVIWGGRIVKVTNRSDRTEIELLAYPLDGAQRPQSDDDPEGRFIAVVPGYLEPLNYPQGRLVTVSGHVKDARMGKVGGAGYTFPVVATSAHHLWTRDELRGPMSNVNIGLGVGVGIH